MLVVPAWSDGLVLGQKTAWVGEPAEIGSVVRAWFGVLTSVFVQPAARVGSSATGAERPSAASCGSPAYRLIVQAKTVSRDRLGGEADVAAAYGREAERILAAYAPPTSSTQHSTSPKCS